MSTENIKDEAKRLLDRLPDNVTWDELMHEIYVRQAIEAGIADSKAGKAVDVNAVRERFGLPSLIDELDPSSDSDVEQLWIAESQRRYDAYLRGELKSVSGEDVMGRVRSRLK